MYTLEDGRREKAAKQQGFGRQQVDATTKKRPRKKWAHAMKKVQAGAVS